MKKDGTAAYGTVFHVVFVSTDDINLNVNLLSTIRAANLHLIKVAHYNFSSLFSPALRTHPFHCLPWAQPLRDEAADRFR